jgi:hypothetical protein
MITKPVMEDHWSACLQTLEDNEDNGNNGDDVAWATFSPNGQQIACDAVAIFGWEPMTCS